MATAATPTARDIMFCHQCDNEWYRDEHGLACPECHSDFTEIIEPQHDPRADALHPDVASLNPYNHVEDDPDEVDIDSVGWSGSNGDRSYHRQQQEQAGEQQASGGLLGFIGSMLPGLFGHGQPETQQSSSPELHDVRDSGDSHFEPHFAHRSEQAGHGTRVQHFRGPGYNVTISTSSSGNLFPRNANEAQPFQTQPDDIQNMMHQMLFNIGAHGVRGVRFGGSAAQGFPPRSQMLPFEHIFQMFGAPSGLGDSQGDAVFSQEALDRVITQLMEQHQSGNAPGPASPEAIASLPQREITTKDFVEGNQAECSICMDAVELGTKVTELPCHHWFHHDCIGAWLGEHDTCPHCRRGITPMDNPGAHRPRQSSQAPMNDTYAFNPASLPGGFPSTSSQTENMHRDE